MEKKTGKKTYYSLNLISTIHNGVTYYTGHTCGHKHKTIEAARNCNGLWINGHYGSNVAVVDETGKRCD